MVTMSELGTATGILPAHAQSEHGFTRHAAHVAGEAMASFDFHSFMTGGDVLWHEGGSTSQAGAGGRGLFDETDWLDVGPVITPCTVDRQKIIDMEKKFSKFCKAVSQQVEEEALELEKEVDHERFAVCKHKVFPANKKHLIVEADKKKYVAAMQTQSKSLTQLVRCLGWSSKGEDMKPVCAAATEYGRVLYVACNRPALSFETGDAVVKMIIEADNSHEAAFESAAEALRGGVPVNCMPPEVPEVSVKASWWALADKLSSFKDLALKHAPEESLAPARGVDIALHRIMTVAKWMKRLRFGSQTFRTPGAHLHYLYFEKVSPLLTALMCLAGTKQRLADDAQPEVSEALKLDSVKHAVELFLIMVVGRWVAVALTKEKMFFEERDVSAALGVIYRVATLAYENAMAALRTKLHPDQDVSQPLEFMLTPAHLLELAEFKNTVFVTWDREKTSDKDLHCEKLLHLYMEEKVGSPEKMNNLNFFISRPPCGSCSIYFRYWLRRGEHAAPQAAVGSEGGVATEAHGVAPHVFGCSGSWFGKNTAYCSVSEKINRAFWGWLCLDGGAQPQASADG